MQGTAEVFCAGVYGEGIMDVVNDFGGWELNDDGRAATHFLANFTLNALKALPSLPSHLHRFGGVAMLPIVQNELLKGKGVIAVMCDSEQACRASEQRGLPR